jgi:hypothetical protein
VSGGGRRGLLERGAALAQLHAQLAAARAGQGSTTIVSGPAGVGKTALVRTFLHQLGGEVRVLTGLCDDLSAARTFGALKDAARGSGGPLARALAAGSIDPVFPAAIAELGGSGPAVLVVEDVQWADDATIDVLGFLARRVHELSALIVLTLRDGPLIGPLAQLLGVLAGTETNRVSVEPLSPPGRSGTRERHRARPRAPLRPDRRQPVLRHRSAGGRVARRALERRGCDTGETGEPLTGSS